MAVKWVTATHTSVRITLQCYWTDCIKQKHVKCLRTQQALCKVVNITQLLCDNLHFWNDAGNGYLWLLLTLVSCGSCLHRWSHSMWGFHSKWDSMCSARFWSSVYLPGDGEEEKIHFEWAMGLMVRENQHPIQTEKRAMMQSYAGLPRSKFHCV